MKLISKIKVRKLCLKDALILASIVSKYVDTSNSSIDAIEFTKNIVEKMSPKEYLQCIYMITNVKDAKKHISIDLLTAFIEGLKSNQVFTLVSFWKSINV